MRIGLESNKAMQERCDHNVHAVKCKLVLEQVCQAVMSQWYSTTVGVRRFHNVIIATWFDQRHSEQVCDMRAQVCVASE